jgi:hypothetical protein
MNAGPIVLIIVIAIALFFILRELYCWYFKTNQILEKQAEQKVILDKILASLSTNLLGDGTKADFSANHKGFLIKPEIVKEKSEDELMAEFDIKFENDLYVYDKYRYEKLTDAINYAKIQKSKENK